MTAERTWWKEAIVYQIYPRSFQDSNGDGVGDLAGIISRLDYIQSLGVDAVWLNPIYQTPNDDGGYDISDYYRILAEFGTMDDFERLVKGLHDRGLKLIMDLVLNHSSDEHPWFVESRKSRENPFRNFYFWRPGKNGGPPNNWPSFFGGSAWELDPHTDEYYLHLFSKKQPDLNWENEKLREEIKKLMKFWIAKGVDGLRLDVISAISKRTAFEDTDTTDFNETIRRYYANGPRLKEFIAEMNESVWKPARVFTVGEGPGITPQNAGEYLDPVNGLNLIFHFGHMFIDQGKGGRFDPVKWTMKDFKNVFSTWDKALAGKGWGSIFLGNHDFARMVSRWGNDQDYHTQSSKLLATLLLTMRGTPFVFQGDEIGMTNMKLLSVADSLDIETRNGWREAKKNGMEEEEFLRRANYSGRDNARTPMAWDESKMAGFTAGQPWMPVNPNNRSINVSRQRMDPNSILSYFQKAVRLRKENLCLVYGAFEPVDHPDDRLFIYNRTDDKEKWLIVLNFSSSTVNFPITGFPHADSPALANYGESNGRVLRPWEALIYKL